MLQQLVETSKSEKQHLQTNLQMQNTNIVDLEKNINEEEIKYNILINELKKTIEEQN
jgi:hypothetical protein